MKKHFTFAIVLILLSSVIAILWFIKLNNKLDTIKSLLQESRHTNIAMEELSLIKDMLQGLPHIEKIKAEQDLQYKKDCKDLMREVYRPSIECHLSNVVHSLSKDGISCDCLRK